MLVDDCVMILDDFGESNPVLFQGTTLAFFLTYIMETVHNPRFFKAQRSGIILV
jgi:hypothetical protein